MVTNMPWLKLFTECRLDKKLARLTLAERGVWVNLLCWAAEGGEHGERGTFDASDRESLAIECADGEEDILNSTLAKLLKIKHLITVEGQDGWLAFRTFAERQKRRPSDEPAATRERQRRSRAYKKSNELSRVVTRDIAKNADVTTLDRDIEREEDTGDRSVLSDGESFIQSNVVVNPSLITKSEDVSTATPSLKILPPPEPEDIAPRAAISEFPDSEERITAQRVAKAYNLPIMQGGHKNALFLEIVDILRPYHHLLSREILVQQAAAHAEHLREKHINYRHALLIDWLDRYISRNEALKDVQRQQLEKSMSNGHQSTTANASTVNSSEPGQNERNFLEGYNYWAEQRRKANSSGS